MADTENPTDRLIEQLEAESQEVLADWAKLQRKFEILCSVPGISAFAAATILARMPDLGSLSPETASNRAGLTPGRGGNEMQSDGHRGPNGGIAIRRALYISVLAGLRCNPVIRADFDRLTRADKPAKVAVTAAMRKLIATLNAMVRADTLWDVTRVTRHSANALGLDSAHGSPQDSE